MKQVIDFHQENGNILWQDALCQEIKNVFPTFEPWEKL